MYFMFKDYATQVQPDRDSNPWHPDHVQYISCPWDGVVLLKPLGHQDLTLFTVDTRPRNNDNQGNLIHLLYAAC